MNDIDGHDLKLSKEKVKLLGRDYSSRISDDAALFIAYVAERQIREHWRLANELCNHAGRSTIMEEDARLAEELIGREI